MYTDDPSTCDSLELKLVDGRLRLRVNTGAGPTILQSSPSLPSLADGAWHRVAVVKLSANTTLQVNASLHPLSTTHHHDKLQEPDPPDPLYQP